MARKGEGLPDGSKDVRVFDEVVEALRKDDQQARASLSVIYDPEIGDDIFGDADVRKRTREQLHETIERALRELCRLYPHWRSACQAMREADVGDWLYGEIEGRLRGVLDTAVIEARGRIDVNDHHYWKATSCEGGDA